ncbi:hypothetical protein ACROYT_G026749 [Oculina patagonica]
MSTQLSNSETKRPNQHLAKIYNARYQNLTFPLQATRECQSRTHHDVTVTRHLLIYCEKKIPKLTQRNGPDYERS